MTKKETIIQLKRRKFLYDQFIYDLDNLPSYLSLIKQSFEQEKEPTQNLINQTLGAFALITNFLTELNDKRRNTSTDNQGS